MVQTHCVFQFSGVTTLPRDPKSVHAQRNLFLGRSPDSPSAPVWFVAPNTQRVLRTCYALCHILYPVSAAHTSSGGQTVRSFFGALSIKPSGVVICQVGTMNPKPKTWQ